MNNSQRMLQYLDNGRRWNKGAYQSGDSLCLVGAWDCYSSRTSKYLDLLSQVIKEQYPDRTDRIASVAAFNDHPDTTWTDIERVLEKTSIKEEENAE